MSDGITDMHREEERKAPKEEEKQAKESEGLNKMWRSPSEAVTRREPVIALHPNGCVYLATPIIYGNHLTPSCCKGWVYGDEVFALIDKLESERAEMIELLKECRMELSSSCEGSCDFYGTPDCSDDCNTNELKKRIQKIIKKAEGK